VETALDAIGPAEAPASRVLRYATFAWTALGANLAVILWGAFVRASGSGAGCGSHWPLCNGEVMPRSPSAATLIELGHRLTSGIALLLVVGLIVGAWRVFPRGHMVRRSAAAAGMFMVLEALIGAGLVLLELVAGNTTVARAWWMAGHLVNTFLLVAALTLTAWWTTHDARPRLRDAGSLAVTLGLALAGMLVLGVSGAITALGDTLFPVTTLAEGEALTFSGAAHVFVRLRLWHPVLACVVGLLIVTAALHATRARREPTVAPVARALVGVFTLNLAVGALNVWWLAPLPMQLVHLLLADLVWITLVVLAASALVAPVAVAGQGRREYMAFNAEEDRAS
jgi:heme A synthase